jgi:Prealbumin-like fold domain
MRMLRTSLVAGTAALIAALAFVLPALASHDEASLPGSNFEIDVDANLKVDDAAPSIDWANVLETRKQDTASGADDESFGQGAKEDTAVPSIVDGGIPPNKSDLKFFGVYQEGITSSGFLNLFWSRVQDPTGTTNMDFEFNQSTTASANGVTPVRTAGDLLIQYDLSNGGVRPTLSIRTWSGSAWGAAQNFSDTMPQKASGSINASAIPAGESDGIGAQSARTFGEAQISLAAIFGGATGCKSFGSAYLKSRSSDQFNSALKDFVPPVAVNISNCGSVKIHKTDDAGAALAGAEFTLYNDNPPVGVSRGAEDTVTTLKCTTDSSGDCTIVNVLQGEYWVVETVTPAGHETAADQHATVTADTQASLTFVNPRQRGAIEVTKVRKHAADGSGDHPQAGVDFTVNGVTKTTDANGKACFDNLLLDDYTVHETVPAGYHGEADKTVTVNNKAGCSDTPYVGETVTFHNTPLTNLTVSVNSQIDGGTASTMACKDAANTTVASGSTGANGDGSASASNLEPGTYTCTVVIDP